ncbi:hypothetical protein I3842_13G069700 [Carya illinoinensis]|uniref:CCT domain-containing protein n=1 Tax=Carya illinoinensis TaxID=32201 RepID=A0A922AMG1_CARIL|nr:hypothetical protein I3842_13G069700 [Carya illinoinensis]KAG6680974.1 hypothetical protein I3842_13G069700 [Carya illinoinensis]
MGYHSFLRSPKKEEQEVPDSVLTEFSDRKDASYADEELDIMDGLEGIWGIEADEKLPQNNKKYGQLNWDFMDWEEFPFRESRKEQDHQQKVLIESTHQCFFEEESYRTTGKVIKKENLGLLEDDDDEKKALLNLNLNYEDVLDAWSNRGSLWADDYSPSTASNGHYTREVPVMEEGRTRREARVLRYKEKRQTRLFSKKIRYQVRKLNADKRPRLKGRFVKRLS